MNRYDLGMIVRPLTDALLRLALWLPNKREERLLDRINVYMGEQIYLMKLASQRIDDLERAELEATRAAREIALTARLAMLKGEDITDELALIERDLADQVARLEEAKV